VAGEVDVMVVPTVFAATQIQAGKVVALAQSGDARAPQLPNVPLLKELSPDVPALPGWYAPSAASRNRRSGAASSAT
jgi:tripartite-type tricarboxylate transporter receptor subunit TctC